MPNLATHLTNSAVRSPDRVAVQFDDLELTYETLDVATAQVAGLLRAKGVAPGDRVAIMLPNVPEFAHCYYGALRAGAVVVPINVLLKDREVAFYLRDSGSKVIFAWHEFAEAAHAGADQVGAEVVLVEPGELEPLLARCEPEPEVVDRATDDTAVILYTSGTTGTPKGAELTHGNLTHNVEASVALFGFDETMVALGALPPGARHARRLRRFTAARTRALRTPTGRPSQRRTAPIHRTRPRLAPRLPMTRHLPARRGRRRASRRVDVSTSSTGATTAVG